MIVAWRELLQGCLVNTEDNDSVVLYDIQNDFVQSCSCSFVLYFNSYTAEFVKWICPALNVD